MRGYLKLSNNQFVEKPRIYKVEDGDWCCKFISSVAYGKTPGAALKAMIEYLASHMSGPRSIFRKKMNVASIMESGFYLVTCPDCHGSGKNPALEFCFDPVVELQARISGEINCPRCKGSKVIQVSVGEDPVDVG